MQILYQLGICFTRWRTGSQGYALEMDKQLSKFNFSIENIVQLYTYVHHGIEIIELAARHLQNVKNKWHQFIWGNLSCDKPFQTFYLDSLLCLYLCLTVCICSE